MSMVAKWWDKEALEPHSLVIAAIDTLKQSQNNRIINGARYDSIYDGVDYLNQMPFGGLNGNRPRMPSIHFNAVRVVGDTLVSKLVQAETKVTFLTDGGDWAERKKAELLDQFVFGNFYRLKAYELMTKGRVDGVRHGNGYIFFSHEQGKVTAERAYPLEVFVDEAEAFAGEPRQMFREKYVSEDVLMGTWGEDPEKAEIIRSSGTVDQTAIYYLAMQVGEVKRVVEAWHLPSYPGAKDGRHIITMETGTLLNEPWDRDTFPCAVFRLYDRSRGFYSIGLVERQLELILTMNKLLKRKHAAIHLLSAPYFLVEAGSRVVKQHFNQDIGNFIEYIGVKPELIVNNVVSSDINNSIQEILQFMYMDAGLNEMEINGQKPQGLDSGEAISRYADTAGVRHVTTLKNDERFVMQFAECILEECRDMARKGQDPEAFGHFKDHARMIKWSELDLDAACYVMKMANMNLLPTQPAGKINEVIRLSNAGVLSPVQSVRALKSPDIDAITADITAPEEDIEWTIYQMTKPKGATYLPPENFQDLEEGIIKVGHAYLRERNMGAPEEILGNLRRWLAQADAMQKAAQDAQMAAQMQAQQLAQAGAEGAGAGGPPQGAPAPLSPIGQASGNPLQGAGQP